MKSHAQRVLDEIREHGQDVDWDAAFDRLCAAIDRDTAEAKKQTMTTAEELATKLLDIAAVSEFTDQIDTLYEAAAKLREQERLLMSQQRKISFLISASKCGAVITEVEEDMLRDPTKELLA